jgi:hypothetical protein
MTMFRLHTCGVAVVIGVMAAGGAGPAADRGSAASRPAGQRRQGALARLPSAAGPHIERIKALGPNAWLNLGPPAPDPKWGKGLGRSWGGKMPYAKDLGGAFLNGTGVHAFMAADGRYTDDIWFYDLNAHRWICIYPGTDSKTFVERIKSGELRVNDDGQLVDKEGQPVPYAAIPHHSYKSHEYDPDQRKYVIAWGHGGLGGDQYTAQMAWHKEGMKLLREQMKGRTDRVEGTPFFYNTITGRFERHPVNGLKLPRNGPLAYVLCYLPARRALWLYGGSGVTMICDPATRRWSNAGAKGPTPKGIDFAACYDSKCERVYVGGGSYRRPWGKDEGKLYVHDVKTNSWSNPPDRGTVPTAFGANVACMHYDSANDRVIHLARDFRLRKAAVYVFDPNTGTWGEQPLPVPDPVISAGECWHGFYSPEVNAHFFYISGDSSDRGTMWVYRFGKAAGQ